MWEKQVVTPGLRVRRDLLGKVTSDMRFEGRVGAV